MDKIAKELLKIAKLLKAKVWTFHQNAEEDEKLKIFKRALGDGEAVKFFYMKKDGSVKEREVIPIDIFKMKGNWAVKGYEETDPRKIEKMFYLGNMYAKKPSNDDLEKKEEEAKAPEPLITVKGIKLVNNDLAKSSYGMMKKNNGLFYSDKQGKFFNSQFKKGKREKIKDSYLVELGGSALTKGDSQFQNAYFFDELGIKEYGVYWSSRVQVRSRAEVDKMYDRMTDRQRDQAWGLQEEDMYEWRSGYKRKWTRR